VAFHKIELVALADPPHTLAHIFSYFYETVNRTTNPLIIVPSARENNWLLVMGYSDGNDTQILPKTV
jgi:hypothetical protein